MDIFEKEDIPVLSLADILEALKDDFELNEDEVKKFVDTMVDLGVLKASITPQTKEPLYEIPSSSKDE